MRFLIGHCKVSAAEKFLSFGCVRSEHYLVSAYQRDRLFDKRLLLHVTAASDGSVGRYDFVV